MLLYLVSFFDSFISYTFIRLRLFLYPINSISYSVLHPSLHTSANIYWIPTALSIWPILNKMYSQMVSLIRKSVTWYDELMQYHLLQSFNCIIYLINKAKSWICASHGFWIFLKVKARDQYSPLAICVLVPHPWGYPLWHCVNILFLANKLNS